MNRELQSLREARLAGRSPKLPVFVTDMQRFQRNMDGVGSLVIWTTLHERQKWAALAGLVVFVHLANRYTMEGNRLIEEITAARPRALFAWSGHSNEQVLPPLKPVEINCACQGK